jgi:hypothetical protein
MDKEDSKKINYEKDLGRNKLENQRKDFAKTIQKINDINGRNIEKLQEDNSREKVDILENSKRELSDNTRSIRDEFRVKHEKTLESYDKRLETEQSFAQKLQEESNDRIETIVRNSENKIQAETIFNHDARLADRKEMRDQVSDLKNDYAQKFKNLKSDFDLELGKVKRESDVVIQRLARKNESDKTQFITESAKEIKKNTNELKDEMMRMSKTSKMEKENLINHYERRIQELKATYDIDKMKMNDLKKNEIS